MRAQAKDERAKVRASIARVLKAHADKVEKLRDRAAAALQVDAYEARPILSELRRLDVPARWVEAQGVVCSACAADVGQECVPLMANGGQKDRRHYVRPHAVRLEALKAATS